ncbi:GTP cyclohydrolase, FolE2/MptA family, partial [Staphylococcus epidermidis]|uniref:GTP cyclohydrolase, FolE2/MptA family n=1 Tax=Staphylococcus epidermidis TaxID=1282 RepID=UPI001642D933
MEGNGSCMLYGMLKGGDEKGVREGGYENGGFVEDLIGVIGGELVEFDWIEGLDIECGNEECMEEDDGLGGVKYGK